MNLAHLHLLINHVPTIGLLLTLVLFGMGLGAKSEHLKQASLVLFVGLALTTIVTYITGNAAQESICVAGLEGPCADPNVSRSVIETHEGAAMVAFGFMQLTGAFAWFGLWQFRRYNRRSNLNLGMVLVLALVTFGLMARAANIGGEIRHPEIMSAPGVHTLGPPLAREVGAFVVGQTWMWPTCETLHFIGLSLLIGVVLMVDLRMLGVMKNVSFPSLHRLLPWGILGFGINVMTGILFFIGAPAQYTQNAAFHWKLALVLIAGVNALYFTIFDEAWLLKPGDDAPFTAKIAAVSAIALWIGVLYCGSMLPFLGNAF
jgi:hypothetical protein